jgi:hypothetical protein
MFNRHSNIMNDNILLVDFQGSIQSALGKFSCTVWLKLKGYVPALAETAFTVNDAYVGSIKNDLYLCITRICNTSV